MVVRLGFALAILGVPWLLGRVALRSVFKESLPHGFSYPVGAALMSVALSTLGLLGHLERAVVVPGFIAAAVLCLPLAGLRMPRRPHPWSLPAGVFAAALFVVALGTPISAYDAIAFWSSKARGFYSTGSILQTLRWEDLRHPDYPFLTSVLEAWAMLVAGGMRDEGLTKLYQPAFFASLIAATRWFLLRQGRDRKNTELFVLMLIATPAVWSMGLANWADAPLAIWAALAGMALASSIKQPQWRWPTLAGLMCGATAATKTEGSFLVAALAIPSLYFMLKKKGWKDCVRIGGFLVGGWLVVCVPWLFARWYLDLGSEYLRGQEPGFVRAGDTLARHIGRVADYFWHFGIEGRSDTPPGLFGLAFCLFVWVVVRHLRWSSPPEGWILCSAVFISLGIYFVVLIVTPHPPDRQLPSALGRLLLHVAPIAIVGTATAAPAVLEPDEVEPR